MDQSKNSFEWWEFIPHVLAALAILCCVIVFAASFTGLAALQFNWMQRCAIGVGAVVLVIILLRWIGQDQQSARLAQRAVTPPKVQAVEKTEAPYEFMTFHVAGVYHDHV